MPTATATKETFGFQAEVKQLMKLMIHSLYSNKEIFLRELISNASDAADKLRFLALSDASLLSNDPELKVWVTIDVPAGTITIRDNGIGMTREDIILNLGTIAKSGTKDFLSNLTGDKAKDTHLIGQFGVGFYSAFMVADKVMVKSRHAQAKNVEAVQWSSTGEGDYELETITKEQRGTEVILHLKETEKGFLDAWHLRRTIVNYSDHITLPVIMMSEAEEDPETKEKILAKEEVINKATALWTLPKAEIDDAQYKEFYKHVAHDWEDPLAWSHFKVEGKQEYTGLLYLPARAPFDLWQANKARGLKLYVQRVFIMDDAEAFLPQYLRFVRGIIDSNNLPLNVSREILQNSRLLDTMKVAITKRILNTLEQLAENEAEKYQTFWKEFGSVLKEGPAEDSTHKEQIAKLLRFATTHLDKPEQTVSLDEYISRMKSSQTKIYYVTAETFNAVKNSPHLEIFRKKGIEVLLLSDRIDEWLLSHLTEYSGKSLQSVARGGLDLKELGEENSEHQDLNDDESLKEVANKVKDALAERVKEVRLTQRLTTSPACIVVTDGDMSPQMERLLKAAGQKVPTHKPILELNPEHPMIQRLKTETKIERFNDLATILLDQAILAEGGQLEDPATFVKRLNALLLEMSH